MITPAISVHAYGRNQLYSSASLRQDELLLFHLCLSFFLVPHKETGKQMISLSTQIIGEKPQTVSGPLWVTIHPSVVLTLLMVALDVRNSDLCSWALPYGITALVGRVWWGASEGSLPPFFSLPFYQPQAPHFQRGCSFCYTLILRQGGDGEDGEKERQEEKQILLFVCFPALLMYN